MDSPGRIDEETWRGRILALYLFAALLLGGGGTPNPATEIALQLLAAVAIVAWVFADRHSKVRVPTLAIVVSLIVLVLPLLQLIPLPLELWQAMPGRTRIADALAINDAGNSWLAWTISAPRTWASFLAMLPPVLLMLGVATIKRETVPALLSAIVAAALLGAMLGAAQLAGGPKAFRLYTETHDEWLTGFFANRNAAVDLFLIAGVALAALSRNAQRTIPKSVFWGGAAVLTFAALLTGSRAGIALIPAACLAVWLILRTGQGRRPFKWRRVGLYGLGAAVVAILLALRAAGSNRIGSIAERFARDDIGRAELWRDTCAATLAHWPWGSGIGTFVPAFIPYERLEAVDPSFPNRAHGEWLEFLLEAGIFAPLIVVIIAAILVHSARRVWQIPAERPTVILASATLLLMTLHGLVDYAFRTMALSSLAGVAAGLLLRSVRDHHNGSETHDRMGKTG